MTYHGHNQAAHKIPASHFDAPQMFHGGRILDPGNKPRSYTQPSYRRAPALRCMLCQQDIQPGERTTYLDEEKVHVLCLREYFDITTGDEDS